MPSGLPAGFGAQQVPARGTLRAIAKGMRAAGELRRVLGALLARIDLARRLRVALAVPRVPHRATRRDEKG
jgi:hypothetical protein